MSEQIEHPVNSSTEFSQRPTPQEVLGQAGRRGPFRYGEHIQVTGIKGHKDAFLLDPRGYFQSTRGSFHHRDVVDMDEGSVIETGTGYELLLLHPLLAGYVLSIPHGAQVVYPKDSGQVIAVRDIFPGARVLEADVGSGALTMNLLFAIGGAGHLLSTERREDFAQIATFNIDAWFGRHHPAWELHTGDLADVIAAQMKPSNINRVVLNMLTPWKNVEVTSQVLAPGGLLLAYVTTVTQLSHTVEALRHSGLFTEPESWESMVRIWNIDGPAMRPDHRMVAHTGFLLTARRLTVDSRPLTRERPPARGIYDEGGYWLSDNVKERTSTDRKIHRVLRDYRARQPSDTTPIFSGSADGDQGGANHV